MSVRVQTPPIIRRITSYPRTRAAELSERYCNGIASLDLPLDLPLDLAQRPARLCALQRLHAEHVTQRLPNNELDHGVRYNGCMPNMSRSASQTTNWTTAYGPNLSHWAEKPWAAPRVEITTRLRAIRGNRKRQSRGN